MEEIWKPIEGYPGHEVSNLGRVKSIDQYVNFHNVKTREPGLRLIKGRVRKNEIDKDGYCRLRLKSGGKLLQVHRLVAAAFIDNSMNHPVVNHLDGVKTNNNVTNLEWCTVGENTKHAFKIGLRSKMWGANKCRA